MSFTNRVMLHAAALALPALLLAASAQAGDRAADQPKGQASPSPSQAKDQDRTVGFGTPSDQPSAPIGHRQPRAADIPSTMPRDPSDAWLDRLNRDLDRKLQFCRGC
jgi:hypothetical protein